MSENATVKYLHQDHLTGTSVMSDSGGVLISSISYMPYGATRAGSVPTDRLFTDQRLDDTGLYYYGARYYDHTIGRFISPDTFVQWSNGLDWVSYQLTVNIIPLGLGSVGNLQVSYPRAVLAVPMNPQSLNRYSYVLNNPLKYIDPTGYQNWGKVWGGVVIIIVVDLFLAAPITLVSIASYLAPPVAPALTAAAAAVDIFAVATTFYSLHLIEEGLSEDSDRKTPQLPREKPSTPPKPAAPTPITSPSYNTTPEFTDSSDQIGSSASGPPPELERIHEKYGGILEQLPDGAWHVLI